jgi:hypothetical protein
LARSVFFSFHYERDIVRVNQVRNAPITQAMVGFNDHSLWEATKLKGESALRSLIDSGLRGASVTVVLIGNQTYLRPWVNYEIEKSWDDGKALLGLRIHNCPDFNGRGDTPGQNPLDLISTSVAGVQYPLSTFAQTYDYVADNGYKNLSLWIEEAAKGRNL